MVSTFSEWMRWMWRSLCQITDPKRPAMTPFRREKLLFEFNTFLDENNDGIIEERDLKSAVQTLCQRYAWPPDDPRSQRVEAVMRDLWNSLRWYADEDQDDKVTRTEWLELWVTIDEEWKKKQSLEEKIHLKSSEDAPRVPDWVKEYFHYKFLLFDVAGDGVLDEEEYVYVMTQHGAIEEVAKKSWFLMTQGRRLLNQAAFEQLCEQFFLSNEPTDPGTFLASRLYFLPGEQRDSVP